MIHCSEISHSCSVGLKSGQCQSHIIYIIFICIKPFSEPSCPVYRDMDILEEMKEMFHYWIKIISQSITETLDFSLLCHPSVFAVIINRFYRMHLLYTQELYAFRNLIFNIKLLYTHRPL